MNPDLESLVRELFIHVDRRGSPTRFSYGEYGTRVAIPNKLLCELREALEAQEDQHDTEVLPSCFDPEDYIE